MQAAHQVPAFLCFVPLCKDHHQLLYHANLLRIAFYL